jgi:hypothetical protein
MTNREEWHVFTFLSGRPSHRGEFASFEAAKARQAELHGQGWYYVPVLSTERAKAENLLPEPGSLAYRFIYGGEAA